MSGASEQKEVFDVFQFLKYSALSKIQEMIDKLIQSLRSTTLLQHTARFSTGSQAGCDSTVEIGRPVSRGV